MTDLPSSTEKQLGLVIDLDICVGCHACAVNCKEWNTAGYHAPLTDKTPYGVEATEFGSIASIPLRQRMIWDHVQFIFQNPASTVRMRPASRSARPAHPINGPKTEL